jgi:hypothetical protein
MKKLTLIIWLSLLSGGVGAIFWYNDWQYNLPTPVPANYITVNLGTAINLPENVAITKSRPLFLHFFNPLCPCSRFNTPHFKSLVQQYSKDVDFGIVVMSTRNYTAKEIQDKYDLAIPVYFDTAIAVNCGVYSTPQAVIIDPNHNLFYRGNYNKTRYCADKDTEFARMALDSLVQGHLVKQFNPLATKAYGCSLPNCNN